MPTEYLKDPGPSGIGAKYYQGGTAPGGIATSGGNTPPPATIPATNPFDFPDEWGEMLLEGWAVPGLLIKIDGCKRPYEWAVQKGTGTGGATTVFRGEKVAESIKTTHSAPTKEHFNGLYELRAKIVPTKGKKPPTFNVSNPIFQFVGIDRIALKELGSPTPTGGAGWELEVEWIEYRPSAKAATGKADPAKPPEDPKPKDQIDRDIDEVSKEVAKP
jgi:hypothetical protein